MNVSANTDPRTVSTLEQGKAIIAALQNRVASLSTTLINRDTAFSKMTEQWGDKLEDSLAHITSLKDNGKIDDEIHDQLQAALSDIRGSIAYVRSLGLSDLHDALAPVPVAGHTPASMGASLTTPITADDVSVAEDGSVHIDTSKIPTLQQNVSTTPAAPAFEGSAT